MHINHVLIQNERSHGEALAISRGSWSVTQTDREVGFAHINTPLPTMMLAATGAGKAQFERIHRLFFSHIEAELFCCSRSQLFFN